MSKPLVLVTSGCYSDYSVHCVGHWLSDKTPTALLAAFLTEFPEQRERYRFCESEFLGWLTRLGAFEEVQYLELSLGDYCTADEMRDPFIAVSQS